MKQELDVIARREEKKKREAENESITMPSSSAPNEASVTPSTTVPPNRAQSTSNYAALQTTSTSGSHMSSTKHIQNPEKSVTKGRPRQIANKIPLYLATKKSKKCSHCGAKGYTICKCQEKLKLIVYQI